MTHFVGNFTPANNYCLWPSASPFVLNWETHRVWDETQHSLGANWDINQLTRNSFLGPDWAVLAEGHCVDGVTGPGILFLKMLLCQLHLTHALSSFPAVSRSTGCVPLQAGWVTEWLTVGLGKDRVAAEVEVGGMERWSRESPLVLPACIDLYTRS